MSKFKLIKEYPASDHEGIIVTQKTSGGMYEGYQYNYYSKDVENNPEYWEEVIETNYQILETCPIEGTIYSVKRISDGEIFTIGDTAKTITSKGSHTITQFRIKQKCKGINSIGEYIYDGIDRIWINWEEGCGGNWLESTEKVIKKDYEILISRVVPQEILSVKRLSDGEVFTVGDLITGHSYTDVRVIEKIKIRYDGSIELEQKHGDTKLAYATKAKNPIFLTHDGKDIFAGDKVWYVNKENFYYDYIIAFPEVKFNSEIRAYFLTREGAEAYIKKNKVLFITADGVGIKQGDMIHGIYKAGNIFAISSTVVRNDNRICEVFEAIFSTIAAAENYVVQKSHSLSIEDFWEFDSWGGSVIAKSKRLKRLVKERLNLK